VRSEVVRPRTAVRRWWNTCHRVIDAVLSSRNPLVLLGVLGVFFAALVWCPQQLVSFSSLFVVVRWMWSDTDPDGKKTDRIAGATWAAIEGGELVLRRAVGRPLPTSSGGGLSAVDAATGGISAPDAPGAGEVSPPPDASDSNEERTG